MSNPPKDNNSGRQGDLDSQSETAEFNLIKSVTAVPSKRYEFHVHIWELDGIPCFSSPNTYKECIICGEVREAI